MEKKENFLPATQTILKNILLNKGSNKSEPRKRKQFKESLPGRPLVSIITVTYNNVRLLENTITSVIEQSYDNVEYIIIDGGSNDGTPDLLKKYENAIDSWISEPDNGIYDGMNKGILLSNGKIINFLNSGDYFYDNNVIEDVILEFNNNQKLKMVNGSIYSIYSQYNIWKKWTTSFSYKNMKNGQQPSHPGTFIKKDILLENGLYNSKYKSSGDFDFYCNILKKNYVHKYIDRTVAVFHSGGISSGSISYIETGNIIKENFGIWAWMKYIIKKRSIRLIKTLMIKVKIIRHYHKLLKYLTKYRNLKVLSLLNLKVSN